MNNDIIFRSTNFAFASTLCFISDNNSEYSKTLEHRFTYRQKNRERS